LVVETEALRVAAPDPAAPAALPGHRYSAMRSRRARSVRLRVLRTRVRDRGSPAPVEPELAVSHLR